VEVRSEITDALVVFQDDHTWIRENLDNLLKHYKEDFSWHRLRSRRLK